MKHLFTTMAAVLLAATVAFGVSVLEPGPAEAASGGYAAKCGGGRILLNANEFQSFHLHNQTRNQRGLAAFCVHPKLQQAARSHSRDMLRRGYFAHGRTGARLRNFGYPWRAYGENIGYNTNAKEMHNSWMNSAGHRRNIVNGNFREIGVGAVAGNFRGSRVVMYTVDFGRR